MLKLDDQLGGDVSKIFSIFSSGGHFIQWSKAACAILAEGILKSIRCNIIIIWVSVSGGDVV